MNKKNLFFVGVALLFGQSVFAADAGLSDAEIVEYINRVASAANAETEGRAGFQAGFHTALTTGDHKEAIGAAFMWAHRDLTKGATRETAVVTWPQAIRREATDVRNWVGPVIAGAEFLRRLGAAERLDRLAE